MSNPRTAILEIVRIGTPILILLGGVAAFWILSNRKQPPATAAAVKKPTIVTTTSVAAHQDTLDIEVDGLVVPFREVELAAEIAGRVIHKSPLCRSGNYVSRGTMLVEIDPSDYELEVRRLTKEFEQAGAMLDELDVDLASTEQLITLAEEEVQLQRRELQRQQRLGNVVSESELDRARRNELAARNSELTLRNQLRMLSTRRARLEQAKELTAVQLEKAQLDLKRTTILAPVDGVIVREWVEQDAYVQKGAALVTIEDTSSVEVKCNLRMEELYWLWNQDESRSVSTVRDPRSDYQIPKTPVTVVYRLAGHDFTWSGVLTRFDGIGLDEQTRTVPCRAVVENPRTVNTSSAQGVAQRPAGPPALVRGMYVTVRIHVGSQARLLEVPEIAVRPGNVIWLVRNGKLDIQPVSIARLRGKDAIIHADGSDLVAGDNIVISPLAVAESGMPVQQQAIP